MRETERPAVPVSVLRRKVYAVLQAMAMAMV